MRAGKIRYIGCSNFSGWHLMKSLAISERYGWPRYVAHQAYYSLVGRDYEWELMPLALDQKVGAVVWSPLGWGRLTGKIRRGQPLPETSRLHSDRRRERGPQVDDEYLYQRRRRARRGREGDRQDGAADRAELAAAAADRRHRDHRRAQRGATASEPSVADWKLTPEQVARLDAASELCGRSIPTGTSGRSSSTQSAAALKRHKAWRPGHA